MVAPVNNTTTSTPDLSNALSGATGGKAMGKEDFLKLLVAQLKNQDPLSPMDSNQFTQQLVQFSQVEQQINSNKNLEKAAIPRWKPFQCSSLPTLKIRISPELRVGIC